jgi:hypothetical protein
MEQPTAEQWLEAGANRAITTEMLDQVIKDMAEKRLAYQSAKALSDEKYHAYEEAERIALEAMRQAGKSKYYCEGAGTAYTVEKLVVPTPKTKDEKQLLFDYVRKTWGEVFLLDKLAIHHQVLQKLYNEAWEEAKAQGKGESFSIPGLQQPTMQISLNLRKG